MAPTAIRGTHGTRPCALATKTGPKTGEGTIFLFHRESIILTFYHLVIIHYLHLPTSKFNCFFSGEVCALEGAGTEYKEVYGVRSEGDTLNLTYVTNFQSSYSNSTNAGSRVYVMDGEENYKMFYLKNRELSIDVDYSNIGCGLNGAIYFVEMDEDGGKSECKAPHRKPSAFPHNACLDLPPFSSRLGQSSGSRIRHGVLRRSM